MKRRFVVLMGAALISLPNLCFSQGFRNPPEGAGATGQAGAFVAQADDPSAITHNPAGLVQLKGGQLLLGNNFVFHFTHYRNGLFAEDKEFNPGFLPYFYYATDLGKENIRFGLGMSSPYGQATEWNWDLVRYCWGYSTPYYAGMQTMDLATVLAYRFSPEFSAGLGLHSYFSRLAINSLIPLPFETSVKVRITGNGFAPGLGLFYRQPKYRLGLSYKHGFNIGYDGKVRALDISEGPAEGKIAFPSILSGGLAFLPKPNLKIEADVEWTGYSSLDQIDLIIMGTPMPQVRNWKDCYTFSLGTEYRKSERLKFRAGCAYLQSPVPNETFEPSTPDANRIFIAAGSELTTRYGIFEISGALVLFQERSIGGIYAGEYKSTGYFLTLGYNRPF